jgi:glycosyltransferase involved in cell wall biosynthesis
MDRPNQYQRNRLVKRIAQKAVNFLGARNMLPAEKLDLKVIRESKYFDSKWYKKKYLENTNENPERHYLHTGFKMNYDPSPLFSTGTYYHENPDVLASGMNPLLHYERYGRKEGRLGESAAMDILTNSPLFDAEWYHQQYMRNEKGSPYSHYLAIGSKRGFCPSKEFSSIRYYLRHPLVRQNKLDALIHYEKFGRIEERKYRLNYHPFDEVTEDEQARIRQLQDKRIKDQFNKSSSHLILFLVPERDAVTGGLMSICSIATVTNALKMIHNSDVIVATIPHRKTFANYSSFDTEHDIFRFSQVPKYFSKLTNLIIHVPEVHLKNFLEQLEPEQISWLQNIDQLRINILNQNNTYLPRPQTVDLLRYLTNDLTMTCAHKKYCVPQLRTAYDMPVHWLSASNLVNYHYRGYEQKENLLAYSSDKNEFSSAIINRIQESIPGLKTQKIEKLSYDQYRELISQAKWTISFGEGIDGYFIEAIRCGAIPFAAYNPTFFDEAYEGLPNIYDSYHDMLENIVRDIQSWDNPTDFSIFNDKLRAIDRREYDDEVYKKNVQLYYEGKFTYGFDEVLQKRQTLLDRKPLVSIVLATYNGERFLKCQLESLSALTYPNLELIVCDDASTDGTLDILRDFRVNYPYKLIENENHSGLVKNFTKAIRVAQGEFVALCDQDDVWLPDKIETLLEHVDDFDVISGSCMVIDEKDNYHVEAVMHDVYEDSHHDVYQLSDFLDENPILGCASLIRKQLIDRCLPIPEGVLYHDWWIMINAVLRGNGVGYTDKVVLNYRQHGENTAFMTFNDHNFYRKLLRFYDVLEDEFADILDKHDYFNLMCVKNRFALEEIFRQYTPVQAANFLKKNQQSFTDRFINILSKKVSEFPPSGTGKKL